jgi:CHAT domain-containing protein/uncharacterized protein HemY
MKHFFSILFFFFLSPFLFAQSWKADLQKADSLMLKKKYNISLPIYESVLPLIEKDSTKNSSVYLQARNGLGYSMIFISEKNVTENYLLENLALCKSYGEKTALYATALHNLGTFYVPQLKGNQPQKSEIYLQEAINLRKVILGEKHLDYAQSLNNLANLYLVRGNFAQAEPLYKASLKIRKEVLGEKHLEYANTLDNLAILYKNMGNYAKAEPLYKENLKIRKAILGEKNLDYAIALNNAGVLYFDMGNYIQAEALYKESIKIYKETVGNKHPAYASALHNLAVFYSKTGNYTQVVPLYEESLQIRKEVLGKTHPDYAQTLTNLANVYVNMRKYAYAQELLEESLKIYKESLGDKHFYYTASLYNLGNLYLRRGKIDQAEQFFKESLQIRKETLGEKHTEYARSLTNLGVFYTNMGKYAQAEQLFKESQQIHRENFGEKHPYYADATNNLAHIYWKTNKFNAAYQLYKEVQENKYAEMKMLFPTFSEKERLAYLGITDKFFEDFQSFAITYAKEIPYITADLYKKALMTKGIVFSSTQKVRKQILSSGDSLLIADYERWKSEKSTYNKLLENSFSEVKKSGINLDSLTSTINELEKSISKRSKLFAKNAQSKDYDWKQVKEKLGKNEVVIEVIRTHRQRGIDSLGKEIQDVYFLVLFVTDKTKKHPEMLIWENGKDLETKYLNYYKNAISLKREDKISYTQYWQPIAKKLKELNKKGFSKIYFSPDGVYHQISLNTLQNPETGKYLLEEQNIQLISTSRDLIEIGRIEKDLSKNFDNYKAYLLGFPTYNLEKEQEKNTENKDRSFSALQQVAGQNVSILPGTKKEIEAITQFFKEKNIKTQTYLEKEASEENFKSFISPTILHTATHGFFVPSPKNKEVETMEEAMRNKTLENPLLRSGLLLAGCENPKAESEDGILTAEDAMNLTLENTELVVLSACETGLGDIQIREGVFGLQRAFQQAGAKTVLMSLWKVSDEATQMLMIEFYKNLLSGKSKRAAFKSAQLSLKQKFPEPYFWGAFVMVGE